MNPIQSDLRLDWLSAEENGTGTPPFRTANPPTRFPVLYEVHLG
jgi:hypothetical protein